MSNQENKSQPQLMQAIRITFSNGKTGDFVGKAVVSKEELDSVSITNVELGEPEDFTDQIRESLTKEE